LGILEPGRNCWRIEQADRAAVLYDAADYYRRLRVSLLEARRSIAIVGWDFDAGILLDPEADDRTLGQLLRDCVEQTPELEVRVLIWSVGVIHGPGAPLPLLLGADWEQHPRITLRLDSEHPIYAAHHQKIVVIDDVLAFSGGIDLTIERWDTCAHRVCDPGRRNPDGTSYGPVHDLQMAVSGRAARAIGDLVRHRWKSATGEVLDPVAVDAAHWPDGLDPDFKATSVAIARTAPRWGEHHGTIENARLAEDALAAARTLVYIEAQYLTTAAIGRVLMRLLALADGPEIIVVMTKSSRSSVEHYIMGHNRDRLVRRLKRVDRYGRLRLYYPENQEGGESCEILVHAKLMIVDDIFLRIGSANLNNRSVGLDTECDLAIEARTKAERASIAAIRHRLVAEHLCLEPEEVAEAVAREGSLSRVIDTMQCRCRCLKPLEIDAKGSTRPVLLTAILDPIKPFEPAWLLNRRKRLHDTIGRGLQSVSLSRRSLARKVNLLRPKTTPPIASGTRK